MYRLRIDCDVGDGQAESVDPRGVRGPRKLARNVLIAVAGVAGLVAVTALAFGGLAGMWISQLSEDLDAWDARNATATTVASLPPETCSAIEAAGRDSGDFLQLVVDRSPAEGEMMSRRQWRAFARDLAPALVRVDRSLRAAERVVPESVSAPLREVIRQVDVGRAELPHASGPADYGDHVGDALTDGVLSLMGADAVLGDACGAISLVRTPVVEAPELSAHGPRP